MQNNPYNSYYKYAFFSAFTTISSFKRPIDFATDEIEPIFFNYRNSLEDIQGRAKVAIDIDETIYRPVCYCLFGDFDLAVFSLINDFGFATKEFKPSASSKGFKYQINTGIIPLVETFREEASSIEKFENIMLTGFFSHRDFYPFTGIALVKLNNAMLIGVGQDFLNSINFFIITYLDQEVEKLQAEGYHLFYILNENLGWNELTINFFGTTMHKMQEVLLGLRSKRLADIVNFLQNELKGQHYNREKIDKEIIPALYSLGEDSLLSILIKEEKDKANDYLQSHPIIATSITYGYHTRLINAKAVQDEIIKELKDEKLIDAFNTECDIPAIHIGWKVKPGHELAARQIIQGECMSDQPGILYRNVQTGKYPFIFPESPISFNQYLDFARKADKEIREEMHLNIIKFRSRIQWTSDQKYTDYEDGHYHYQLSRFQIPKPIIEEVQEKLRVYPVPYTLKGQVENVINNFNDAIGDPLMYSYFLGLKQSLVNFLVNKFNADRKKEGSEKPDITLEDVELKDRKITRIPNTDTEGVILSVDMPNITEFLVAWNKAYWNRYFHSYYFTEINDFNIEHHGGIQQILFTYDTMYKLVAKRIYGSYTKGPFVNVQVAPGITSSQFFNTINFNHLFRPAIYACECVHEAANHVIPFLVSEQQQSKYAFLLNTRKDIVEPSMLNELKTFEKKLKDHLYARDDNENDYFDNNFGLNTIRQIVTDYLTYRLAYEHGGQANGEPLPIRDNLDAAIRFYHTHWFLFLMKAEMYAMESNGKGAWFFKEDQFKMLFIRFNLMFAMFYNCTEAELKALNQECPSIELHPMWEYQKSVLIDFVLRLAASLRIEFDRRITGESGNKGMDMLKKDIEERIIRQGLRELNKIEHQNYESMIRINFNLIDFFYQLFTAPGNEKYNIVIRKAKSEYTNDDMKIKGIKNNVWFWRNDETRGLFLDPKGNLFSITQNDQCQVFRKYVWYIKSIWNLSMKTAIEAYKAEMGAL